MSERREYARWWMDLYDVTFKPWRPVWAHSKLWGLVGVLWWTVSCLPARGSDTDHPVVDRLRPSCP